MKAYINAKVITPYGIRDKAVLTSDGVITDITDRYENADETVDCGGNYLAPGLVDIHVHGGGGYSAMSEDPEDIIKMCRAHAMHGTTSVLPTALASPVEVLHRAVETIGKAAKTCDGVHILGVHLEGPFLSPKMAGAQSPDSILPPTKENVTELLRGLKGVKMIGAAPELDGAFFFAGQAAAAGITVSAAHTACDFETAEEALKHGFSDVTHLYSACSQMHKEGIFRKVGIVEAALCRDEYTTQFIADMRHIPAGAVKLIYKCKGADRAYAISDGLEFSAGDLTDGMTVTQENGQKAICENGVMMLADRSCLAGSIASGDILLRNLYKEAGIPLEDCVKMMTDTPLSVIGMNAKKGRIEKGCDADIIVFDGDIDLKYVCAGQTTVLNRLQ